MGPCIANVFSSTTNKMQSCTIIYFCEMFYMFQAVPPPIIRSSKLYISIRYLVKPLLLPATILAGSSKVLTKYRTLIYSFELLMMGGGTA